ncbi:DUF1593 domain-containing protein [Desertivirga xinjiangensis]|uniref:DUF1593 domain-containing protein n=1 Tax=Desertivirga xinjiangensis TaxID=539206 RepID=UPI00210E2B09|nr:DUF1593 domain-containing protein [Pedobacter xinjiangensis]
MQRKVLIVLLSLILAFIGGYGQDKKHRVIILSDIGGYDEDDDQSFIHYLFYADCFATEGLISSPPGKGRAKDFREVIDLYRKDYSKLQRHGSFPSPRILEKVVKQGAVEPAPAAGHSSPTEGSKWLIRCARKPDPRPLFILVWGSITDLAQAVHDAPDIKPKLRVHFIASWNQRQDSAAFRYIEKYHTDIWMIQDNSTFRGWYSGGIQTGDLGNKSFVEQHIARAGAMGSYFATLKQGSIKMGDSPSVARLLYGNPENPEEDSWGGRFSPLDTGRHWWIDDTSANLKEGPYPGARTVNKWREAYLRDWQKRLSWLSKIR